jgi:hypothetical protein
MRNIVVINETARVADAEIEAMLPAFEQQWNLDLTAAWGVEPAAFAFLARGQAPAPGAWWVVFLDDSDQAGALAYHDLTNEGLPLAKVFVSALLADGASISVGASHEICEMAVDPWLNSAYQDPTGTFWAGEVCDPVEDDQYGYRIGEVLVSDFVTPGWFGHARAPGARASCRLDQRDHADIPFQILSGGYAQLFQARKGWVQVTGAKAMRSARGKTAVKGSRRERRARQATQALIRSRRRWPGSA